MLREKIEEQQAIIAVVGIGYVGLPLAVEFAEKGFRVIGIDANENRVESIGKRKSYIGDITDEQLRMLPNLTATANLSALAGSDIVFICVPTPITKAKNPDLTYVTHVVTEVARYLHPEQMVVLESTTYPGTTREVVWPILQATGCSCYLAYSPEMIDPGNRQYGLKNTPKIVGGINDLSRELAISIYRQVTDQVIPVTSPDVAEMVKIYSNVFRSVNIALANEMVQLCQSIGISVWEVLRTVAQKPFGYMPFYPGVGVGGHCIPCDPYYLSNKAREHDFHTRFIELAGDINEGMPRYVAMQILRVLNARRKTLNGSHILVLGVSYKRDTADTRDSPSIKLIELLMDQGARVDYSDPFVPEVAMPRGVLVSCNLENIHVFCRVMIQQVKFDPLIL